MTDKKLRTCLIATSILILLCGLYSYYTPCTRFVNSLLPDRNNTIALDPGHGGYDPGKVGIDGSLEKDVNLAITLLLKEYLEKDNFNVIMTRDSDKDLCSAGTANKKTDDLNNRIKIIDTSNPLFAISIHQNSFQDSSVSGAQVFYYGNTSGSKSENLAKVLQSSLVREVNPDNHRLAKSNTDYYLLKNSVSPIVIVECGFLSNPSEAALLNSTEYQEKIAKGIYAGIKEYCSN